MPPKKRPKCAQQGCRRVSRDGDYCKTCAKKRPKDTMDAVKKLTAVELARLGQLGAELDAAMLSVKLSHYELRDAKIELERQVAEKMSKKEEERRLKADALQRVRKQYDMLTFGLSKKYGISDPKKMVVDTESGLIRDADDF